MGYKEDRFTGSLARLVDCAWSMRWDRTEAIVHPDGYSDLLFSEEGHVYVSGTARQSRRLELTYGTSLSGIRLKSGSIPFLFRTPASSVANQIRCVTEFSSPFARAVVSTSRQSDSVEQLKDAVINLVEKKARDCTEDPRLAFITSGLHRRSMRSTASALGLTERHLHRLVMQEIGVSPSRLKKIQRLQRLLDAMRRQGSEQTLATFALNYGFFDQAHMNHEVKSLTAMTPGALYRSFARG